VSGVATLHLQPADPAIYNAERVLTVAATTMNPLMTALHMILSRLQSTKSEHRDMVQWVIPQDKVGLVVGKQGHTIKKINELTKAWVKIANPEEPTPYSGGRSIYVRGQEDHVKQACDMIHHIAGGSAVFQTVVPVDAVSFVTAGNLPCRVEYPMVTGVATATIHSQYVNVVKSRLKAWLPVREEPLNLVVLSNVNVFCGGVNVIRRDAESCCLEGSLNDIVQNVAPFCESVFMTPFLC
jgi:hypothetical protein